MNGTDERCSRALFDKARRGPVDEGRRLLALRADVNYRNHKGGNMCTVLHQAILFRHTAFVKMLFEHKVDVNKYTAPSRGNCNTPLLLASARRKTADTLALFLAHPEVDVNRPSRFGNTPLHFAARYGRVQTVKKLLSHRNTIVEPCTTRGNTPLSFCFQRTAHLEKKALLVVLLTHGTRSF
jgi:ankyrin repeat protein